jgi:phosphoglucomutase
LLDANNVEELERRLRYPIKFGTAGLRAAMEAGFAGMNNLTVIQASQVHVTVQRQLNHLLSPWFD